MQSKSCQKVAIMQNCRENAAKVLGGDYSSSNTFGGWVVSSSSLCQHHCLLATKKSAKHKSVTVQEVFVVSSSFSELFILTIIFAFR